MITTRYFVYRKNSTFDVLTAIFYDPFTKNTPVESLTSIKLEPEVCRSYAVPSELIVDEFELANRPEAFILSKDRYRNWPYELRDRLRRFITSRHAQIKDDSFIDVTDDGFKVLKLTDDVIDEYREAIVGDWEDAAQEWQVKNGSYA